MLALLVFGSELERAARPVAVPGRSTCSPRSAARPRSSCSATRCGRWPARPRRSTACSGALGVLMIVRRQDLRGLLTLLAHQRRHQLPARRLPARAPRRARRRRADRRRSWCSTRRRPAAAGRRRWRCSVVLLLVLILTVPTLVVRQPLGDVGSSAVQRPGDLLADRRPGPGGRARRGRRRRPGPAAVSSSRVRLRTPSRRLSRTRTRSAGPGQVPAARSRSGRRPRPARRRAAAGPARRGRPATSSSSAPAPTSTPARGVQDERGRGRGRGRPPRGPPSRPAGVTTARPQPPSRVHRSEAPPRRRNVTDRSVANRCPASPTRV